MRWIIHGDAHMAGVSVTELSLTRGRAMHAVSRAASARGVDAAASEKGAAENAIAARFVTAYESADIDALVALFTDEVFMSMPPIPLEYRGRDSVARFFAFAFGTGQIFRLVPTRANGQPAFGVYQHTPTGIHGAGLFVLTLTRDRIDAITRFENTVLSTFGLPQTLPSAQ
jgi:ketosteroid isomerase-like protein